MSDAWLGINQYQPRGPFRLFHAREQRWAAMVCHRRAGKTVACVADLVYSALFTKKQDARFAYIDPFLNQAKDAAWTYVKRLVQDIPGVKKNESDLFVELTNGARVRLYGADNPDRIRGGYFDGVILDEYADMAPSVWGEIIRPMLADRQGWAVFIGTPKGQNDFYRICKNAEENPEWHYLCLRASDSGLLPPGELEEAKKDMTPEQVAQEFECSFNAAIQGAYWGKELAELERLGRIKSNIYDPILPVHTAWDLGMGDSTAIWCFQVAANEPRVIDFYENHSEGLGHYVEWLAKQPYQYGDDYVPHDAKVRELGTGRTRIETLIGMGRRPKLVPNHGLMDGINAARLTLPSVWFDTKTRDGIEALKQYRADYDEKARTFRDRPKHDWTSHAADAFRYLCMAWKEIKAEPEFKPKPALRAGPGNQVTFNDMFKEAQKLRSGKR